MWNQTPRCLLSTKSQAAKQRCFENYFPAYFPKLFFSVHGMCLVHPSPGQNSGSVSNSCNTDVGLSKKVARKQVGQAKCPMSRRRAARSALFPAVFYNRWAVNFDCLDYFPCELFWTSRKCPLHVSFSKESGKSGCFAKTLEYRKVQKTWYGRLAISVTPSTGGIEGL